MGGSKAVCLSFEDAFVSHNSTAHRVKRRRPTTWEGNPRHPWTSSRPLPLPRSSKTPQPSIAALVVSEAQTNNIDLNEQSARRNHSAAGCIPRNAAKSQSLTASHRRPLAASAMCPARVTSCTWGPLRPRQRVYCCTYWTAVAGAIAYPIGAAATAVAALDGITLTMCDAVGQASP